MVLADADAGVARHEAAMAVAQAFRARVVARGGEQPTHESFEREAQALPAGCCRYEQLPPFDAEGRTPQGSVFVSGVRAVGVRAHRAAPLVAALRDALRRARRAVEGRDAPVEPHRRRGPRDRAPRPRDARARAAFARARRAAARLRDRVEISESTLRAAGLDRVARSTAARPWGAGRRLRGREVDATAFTPVLDGLLKDLPDALCATFLDAEGGGRWTWPRGSRSSTRG